MRVLITGPGKGGTNLTTEIVRASGVFDFTSFIEDRTFFNRHLYDWYGTKLATENKGFTSENILNKLVEYSDLHIIFTTRHPFDLYLSKIYRGRPGGDVEGPGFNQTDGTHDLALATIFHCYDIFKALQEQERVMQVKLEDIIMNLNEVVQSICSFLHIEQNIEMFDPFAKNRNQYHQRRYGGKMDKNQVDLYKNLDSVFDGYFSDVEYNGKAVIAFDALQIILKEFGYKDER